MRAKPQPTKWSKDFEASCRHWQDKLGLTDWTLQFRVAHPKGEHEAEVHFDTESRHATVTAFVGVENALPADRVGAHEMLHLLFADWEQALKRRDTKGALREEHRVVERLLNSAFGDP
jgi:hypothetical protein